MKTKLAGFNPALISTIMALALPTMLEQLMQTAVQYIDMMMVGSLGTAATAAVGSTTTVNWLVGSTISALGVGFLAIIARAIGEGNRPFAKRAVGQTVMVVLVSGLTLTLITLALSRYVPIWMQVDPSIRELSAQYFFILYTPMLFRAASILFGTVLRAAGDTKTPMRVGIIVNIVNVVLNFFLIFPTCTVAVFNVTFTLYGAGMGVIGAAVASAVAFAVGGILMTLAVWKHPTVSPRGCSLYPDKEVLLPCFKIALPNMFQRFGTSLGYVAFASMINSLGDVATAAHSIANTVESAFYIPGYGMQTASATLAGNALGQRDTKRLKELTATIVVIEVCLMVLSGGLLFAFAPAMMAIFNKDIAVITLGAVVLRMVALSEPFYGVSIVLEGVMQGLGRTAKPFVFNIIGMWGVRIVGTFLCTQLLGLGLEAAWGCMILHNLFLFALLVIYWRSNRWNPLSENDGEKV